MAVVQPHYGDAGVRLCEVSCQAGTPGVDVCTSQEGAALLLEREPDGSHSFVETCQTVISFSRTASALPVLY